METPTGWYQVLRGLRPKAEQWPRRQPWGSSSWQSWGQWRAQEPQSPPFDVDGIVSTVGRIQKKCRLQPFWLKPFLAQGSRCSRAVCRLLFVCFSFLFCGCPFVREERGPMPKGWTKAPVLDGSSSKSGKKSPQSRHQGRSSVFPSLSAQSPTRASRRGGKRGGLEVGGSSEGSRREQRSREAPCRGVEGGQSEITSSPSEREVDSLLEFSRTSPKASRQSRRVDCKSHGANGSLRVGSARGRRMCAAIRGRSGEANTTFSANSNREIRGVGARTRCIAGQCSDAGSVVRRWPPIHRCHPADAKFQSSRWNCELRNVLEFGDTTIAKMGALVGQGSAALGCFAAAGTVDGPRSILMSAAKRRCLAAGSELVLPSMTAY